MAAWALLQRLPSNIKMLGNIGKADEIGPHLPEARSLRQDLEDATGRVQNDRLCRLAFGLQRDCQEAT